MADSLPPSSITGASGIGSGTISDFDQAALRRLSEATTAEEFASLWLDLQSRAIGGVTGGVVAFQRSEDEAFVPAAVTPRGERDRSGLAAVMERAIKERRGVAMRSGASEAGEDSGPGYLIALPVTGGGGTSDTVHGVAALELAARPEPALRAAMRQLQWGLAWLQTWILRRTNWPDAHLKHRLTTAVEMAALILQEKKFRSAATSFLTEMATRFECDRASLGLMKGRQVKVQALSHSADFKKQMNLIRAIGAAMSESLDQQSPLVYPESGEEGNVLRAHEELARSHGDRAICTIPFVDQDGLFFGALTLERSQPAPFDRAVVDVCESVAAIAGPLLEEKRLADRMLIIAARDSAIGLARKLAGPRHTALKLIFGGIAAIVIILAVVQGQFRVTARTTLEGEVRRVVAAPYRGFINEAPVRAGDIVNAGDVLCRLDDRDLVLERTKWSTEREQHFAEHRKAMAESDLAAMNVLSEKIAQADAQIALLDEQIARARIVAPFRGLVVNGDLSQSLGAPVDTGQVLFEVAPLDSYRLVLQVEEWDIRHIRSEQTGALILTSLPQERFPFTVTKITPVSLAEEGRSYFKVEARIDGNSERLRPGMEGFAKVDIDHRRLIWIWTHDMVDWIRLKAWSLLP